MAALTRTESSLVLPDKVALQLCDSHENQVRIANVLFRVHAFARHKNDFNLGPYPSDGNGIVTILKRDLEAEASAHYDAGLMDHVNILDCFPEVEVSAFTHEEILKAIEARTKVWTKLLHGERERWRSIDELLGLYRSASKNCVRVRSFRAVWDGTLHEYSYSVLTERI